MSDPNDIIYGVHPVAEALKNPKRKIYSLKASKNAADRLAAEITARGIEPEIVHPRDLDKKLGAEGKGLRQLTRDSCDHLVRLDMNGPIRSLNVSNACAVTLYALTR